MPQQTDPIKQFRLALVALVALVILGVVGYHILMRWNTLDSLFMTIITLTTVGYNEVHTLDATGKVFSIILIVFGVTTVFWAGASLIEAVVGEQIWHAIQRKRMQNRIAKLHDHYIICGYGRMGQQIIQDLIHENVPHVVIERNPEQIPKLINQEIPFIEGDASDDKILRSAGIERAKGLITVAPSDEDNVFITLSARALNPNLYIVARSILEDNENKLRMAGANRTMSPYVMGGRRMSLAVLRPNVLDFIDLAMRFDDLRMMIEEMKIEPDSRMLGKTIADCGFRDDYDITVLAIKKLDGRTIPNPRPADVIDGSDILILLGSPDQLNKIRESTER